MARLVGPHGKKRHGKKGKTMKKMFEERIERLERARYMPPQGATALVAEVLAECLRDAVEELERREPATPDPDPSAAVTAG